VARDDPIELEGITISQPDWWTEHVDVMEEAMAIIRFEENEAAGRSEGEGEDRPVQRLTYSVDEAAELLGISRTSAYEAIRKGEIPHIKIGKRILIPKSALTNLLQTQ
jgi:excisionase family DNA binding protein